VRRVAGGREVVGEDVAGEAVRDGVLELVEHVHPVRLVRGALLDELVLHRRLHVLVVVGGHDERVGVVVVAPVRAVDGPELLGRHLGRARRREALERADRARALDGVALGVRRRLVAARRARPVAVLGALAHVRLREARPRRDVRVRAEAAAALGVHADRLVPALLRRRARAGVDLLLVEVDHRVRDDVRERLVARDGRVGVAARLHAGEDARGVLERADVGAREAEARVRLLDLHLERGVALGRHGRGVGDVEVLDDHRRDVLVAGVDAREDRGREGPALGPLLGAVVRRARAEVVVRVRLERVLEHALDERDGHLVDDELELRLDVVALLLGDLVRALLDELERLGVGGRAVVGVVDGAVARPEVLAALLREVPELDAREAARLALERARVERPALVPRVRRVAGGREVVGEDVAGEAVRDGVLELVEHVHPVRLVRGALLHELGLHLVDHVRVLVRRLDERVGVGRVLPVVGVEVEERLRDHLVGREREALERADGPRALDGVALGRHVGRAVAARVAARVAVLGAHGHVRLGEARRAVDVGLRAEAAAALGVDEPRLVERDGVDAVGLDGVVDLLLVEVDHRVGDDVRRGREAREDGLRR